LIDQEAKYVHKSIDEMESIWGGSFVRVRAELGTTAFGIGLMRLPPNLDRIPYHSHTFDGQEEVYVPIAGSGWIALDDLRVPLDAGTAVRVGPTVRRALISGPDGLEVLTAGGTPGKAYEPFVVMEKGAPEPDPAALPGVRAAAAEAEAPRTEAGDDYEAVELEGGGERTGMPRGVLFSAFGRTLGATAFGISELQLDPDVGEAYPRHDHEPDLQQELYVAVSGSGTIGVDGEDVAVTAGEMVLVMPDAARHWRSGPDGLRMIVIGAPAGRPYKGSTPRRA
jgi:uncharacterized cupin superfamily protein